MRPHRRFLVILMSTKVTVFIYYMPGVHALEEGAGFFHILMQTGRLRDQRILQVIIPALRIFIGMMRRFEMQHHAERFLGVTRLKPL